MSKPKRKYSRPNGHVEKVYPIAISKVDSNKKSLLTGTKTLGFKLKANDAANLAVALINGVNMISKEYPTIDLTIRIHDNHFSVSLG